MNDLKFAARMVVAIVATVLIMGLAQRWDDADSQRIRISMMNRT